LLLSTPSSPWHYTKVFPAEWYEYDNHQQQSSVSAIPKPLGLCLGILAVAIGQVAVWIFFAIFRYDCLTSTRRNHSSRNNGTSTRTPSPQPQPSSSSQRSIQTKGERSYNFWEGLATHVSQPEGFVLLVGYLSLTWMGHFMPASYYSFDGTIQWPVLALCLILQDAIQYLMHILEHVASPSFYQLSHKPHHRFTNPRLFDAFNGSFFDTLFMIIVPLFLTANLVRISNVWTYMAFGSSYAGWLTLIHSEYPFVWDPLFRTLGLGTPADHHVHHKFFKFNYGHLFLWWDQLAGTYRDPQDFAPKVFRYGV